MIKRLDFSQGKTKCYFSIEAGLVSALSFWTGHQILSLISPNYNFIGGFWCMVCAICMLYPCITRSITAAKLRMKASLLGFAISGFCCFCLGYGYVQMLLAIALTVFTTRLFKFYSATRMAAIQASIVMVIGIVFPNFTPFLNLSTRLLETIAGLAIGFLAIGLSHQIGSRKILINQSPQQRIYAMKPLIKKYNKPIYMSIEAAFVGVLGFILGYEISTYAEQPLSFWGGIWCMSNALAILFAFMDSTLNGAKFRMLCTSIGCSIGLFICLIFGVNYLAIVLAVSLTVLLVHVMGFEQGSRVSCCVVVVIIGINMLAPNSSIVNNTLLRFLESALGAMLAIFVAFWGYVLGIREPTKPTKSKKRVKS